MSGIPGYMFRQIGGPLLFFTFVLTGVIWLSQSLRMLDLVINQSQSAATYLYLTVLALPQLMALILPFALFLRGALCAQPALCGKRACRHLGGGV